MGLWSKNWMKNADCNGDQDVPCFKALVIYLSLHILLVESADGEGDSSQRSHCNNDPMLPNDSTYHFLCHQF